MVEIWQEVLGLGRVGVHDDFFELGGNSINATMLANRIRTRFDVELPIVSIFRAPTVSGLVDLLEAIDDDSEASVDVAEVGQTGYRSENDERNDRA